LKKENSNIKWVIESFILTFILSGTISYISSNGVEKLNIVWALILLVFVIFLGIFFDIVALAVTVADESHFHAKATKRITGAKTSIKLIKNASKVANICADVIGDICGVISGAISTMIAFKLVETAGMSDNVQFLISAFVASLTVSGKAFGKEIAKRNSTKIVHVAGIIMSKIMK
jgi:CBS domain containing-hemolysin-like protein